MPTDAPLTTAEAARLFGYSEQVLRRILRTPGAPRPIPLHSQKYLWRRDELDKFLSNRRARLAARSKR